MTALGWDYQDGFGGMGGHHYPYPRRRDQMSGPLSPIAPLSPMTPIILSPTTPTTPTTPGPEHSHYLPEIESTPSLVSSSSTSLLSLDSMWSSTTSGSPPTPAGSTLRTTTRSATARKKLTEAVYDEGIDDNLDFATLLATIPSELPEEEDEDPTPSLSSNVTQPLQVKRIPPPRSASLLRSTRVVTEPAPFARPLPRSERKASLTQLRPQPARSPSPVSPQLNKVLSRDSSPGSSASSSSSHSTNTVTRSRRKPPPRVEDLDFADDSPSSSTTSCASQFEKLQAFLQRNQPSPSPGPSRSTTPTPPKLQVHPPDGAPVFTPLSPSSSIISSPTAHAVSTTRTPTQSAGRQAIVHRAPTSRPYSPRPDAEPKPRPAKGPPELNDKRSVRVEMVDIDKFLLRWDAPELVPTPKWLTSACGYVLENQRLVIDIHRETPPAERKWLLKVALDCYLPMRERYLDVMGVLAASMPEYSLEMMKSTPPPVRPEMKRNEFKRSGEDPPQNLPMSLPRIVLPNLWRNTYRLLHNASTEEALWVPNGVVLDLTDRQASAEDCIKLDDDTPEDAKSATMNTMLLHALRRLTGDAALPPPDLQRAMGRCKIRRLSFHPGKVAVVSGGGYGGGILDVSLPAPRGGAPTIPVWHQPVRVYLTSGGEFWYEYAATTPDWRIDEIKQVVEEHIGAHLEAWSDICRILTAFASSPSDARVRLLAAAPAPARRGYERHEFVPQATRGPGPEGSMPPRGTVRAEADLPRLSRRRRGLYALEYPDLEPAILDYTAAKPRVYVHEQAKHVTPMVAWLFKIVGALYETDDEEQDEE